MTPSLRILRHQFILPLALTLSLICLPATQGSAAQDPFPLYPSIKANVAFWKQVYAKYPSTKGLIHDCNDLSIIYEVIDLRPDNEPGSRAANKRKTNQFKDKYRNILQALANGEPAITAEQKKVVALFGSKGGPAAWQAAAGNIRFQLCLSDRFQAGVMRSGRYLDEIVNIFQSSGLPADLAYLPHVESSFNYNAYSKFGAAGIWQFIRSTGRRFMTVEYTLDERRDPIIASHAAAKYLKENYNLLGSWPLALTAYNHGGNSMLRAKNKHGGYEEIYNDYQNRNFGFASKNFYAEFLAAREVAKNYQSYFKGLQLDQKIVTFEVKMNGYAAITDIASHFGVGLKTLQELNPALRRPVFIGQKYIPRGYTLKLPSTTDSRLARIPAPLYKPEQKRSRFYQVERGDTAGKIARMHKVPLHDLIEINQLSRRATIFVGQNLRIPGPGEVPVSVLAAAPARPLLPETVSPAAQATIAALPPTAAAGAAAPQAARRQSSPPAQESYASPVAQQAAPLIAAAAQERTAAKDQQVPPVTNAAVPSAAAESNQTRSRLSPDASLLLAAREILQAPDQEEAGPVSNGELALEPPTVSVAEINPEVVVGNFQIERVYHKKGKDVGVVQIEYLETLGHYAEWLEIPTQQIRQLNGFSFQRRIKAHQKIEIPLKKVGKDLFEERRYEFHKEIEEDFFAAYQVIGTENYRIKKGDNIWTLCMTELELPFWLIKKYNPALEITSLMPNQQLVVPVVEKLNLESVVNSEANISVAFTSNAAPGDPPDQGHP